MNAQNPQPRHRPHFRHAETEEKPSCAEVSLQRALEDVLVPGASVQLPPLPAATGLFDAASPDPRLEEIASFEFRDATSALIRFPDGREYRVAVIAIDSRGPSTDSGFDLILDLTGSGYTSAQSVDQLRHYLTLDPTAWRWCRFQTAPTLAPAPESTVASSAAADIEAVDLAESDGELEEAPAITPSEPAGPLMPKRAWQERHVFRDGSVVIADRQIWPNGVMTERSTTLPRGSEPFAPKPEA